MRTNVWLAALMTIFLLSAVAGAQENIVIANTLESHLEFQHNPVEPNFTSHLAVRFELAEGLHFYADEKTAPPGKHLQLKASADGLKFAEPIFPFGHGYFDKNTETSLRVFSGDFTVYIPFKVNSESDKTNVAVSVDGLTCSDQLCMPIKYKLSKSLTIAETASKAAFELPKQTLDKPAEKTNTTPAALALGLAIVAGLLLNVMPCVWPILPIIIMRILDQAKQSRAKSITLGLAFSLGIILFFVALAAINIILKLSFGIVFQWGDQFRNPAFVTAMGLLMVVLAMFMFGVFGFGIGASLSGKADQKKGFAGSVATGFLAAVLSTPCSFAILTFVLAWAQTQPLLLSTITILLIGVGMSLPYLILTSMPALLAKVPKPGKWMELFKQATGFLLLAIGVKLIEALPETKLISLLYYAVILAVCVWIWGTWVSYNTKPAKKWAVRFFAVAIAVIAGLYFLPEPKAELVEWQKYDAEKITAAQDAGRPVLIKFTADWCTSCKIVDKLVYSNKTIADLIKGKNVLAIKGDTTDIDYPASIALQQIYNEPAVPVTVLLLPGQSEPVKLHGTFIKGKLKKYLIDIP